MHADTATSRRPRIFSVPAGRPFLPELARALIDGRLVEDYLPGADPVRLADATIFLPTRRAARAFGEEILRAAGAPASYLPAVRTLGDVEEDEFAGFGRDDWELPPAVGEFERRLELASLVRGWAEALSDQARQTFADEAIVLPSSTADAVWLAGELAGLLDQMETEEIPWHALAEIPGDTFAQWWDLTAQFLRILTETWPSIREESGRIEPAVRRTLLLDRRIRALAAGEFRGPVIVAGSTGSIPATARFMAAVARHDAGAIVLPGLDLDMPDPVWKQLQMASDAIGQAALAGHAQAGLAKLLARIGVVRDDVDVLGGEAVEAAARRRLVAASLLPAGATGAWHSAGKHKPGADAAISVVEAPNARQEALAIAIALREVAEQPQKTAALVTPDRSLARRVAAELERFGIEVDDSAGRDLAETSAGAFMLLVARIAAGETSGAAIAELCTHPMVAGTRLQTARNFELAVLRSAVPDRLPGCLARAADVAREHARTDRHLHSAVARLTEEDWSEIGEFAAWLDAVFDPAADWPERVSVRAAVANLTATLFRLCPDPDVWLESEGGPELIALLDRVEEESQGTRADDFLHFDSAELPNLLRALLAEQAVRKVRPTHPRLHIWGPLEARLQDVDLFILGGLNEGTWPAIARNDAYLNRPMRALIGLSPPERRTGQAAHDFEQLASRGEVILTRALRDASAPTIASRWLQRLLILSGAAVDMRARGERLLALVRRIDAPAGPPKRSPPPEPKPPVALRPNRLSVTEIETLIRDPYAIHARHVLGLRRLPALDQPLDFAIRGILLHDIVANFVRARPAGETRQQAILRFGNVADEVLAGAKLDPDEKLLLQARFAEIGRAFVDFEEERLSKIAVSLVEVGGSVGVSDGAFRLSGRADRIDILNDGAIEIIDYKSSQMPGVREAQTFSPQLALEAGMARLKAFGNAATGPLSNLVYVRLNLSEELQVRNIIGGKDGARDPAELVGKTWARLEQLVAGYRDPLRGYPSRIRVKRAGEMSGEFDHLARVREWSAGIDTDDE